MQTFKIDLMTIFRKRPLMTSEVVEVTEVNYLEVTEELFIYVVVPENGSFSGF